jgi:colicin import membrane protein
MRPNYFKSNILLATFLVLTVSLNAQQTTTSSSNFYDQSNGRTGKSRITINDNDKTYHMEFTDDKLSFLSVDGVLVPQEKWGDYNKIVNNAREQIKKDREQARLDRIQAGKDREQARLDRLQADKDREQALKDRDRVRLDRLQADRDREQAMRDKQQADRDRIQADKDREQAVRDRAQAEKDREQAGKDRIQAEKDRAQAAADRKLLADLTDDLVSDKLISSTSDLRLLTLTPTEMTVNGVKQPDAVYKKYQEKYDRFSRNSLTYVSDGNNRQINMRRNN